MTLVPDDPRVGHVVGNYQLKELIGLGGMGAVFRAEHLYIGKQVAIKLLHRELAIDGEAVERFLLEACAAARIGHANIVDVTDFGRLSDGTTYLIMEYVRGPLLENLLRERGTFPLLRSINIVHQMAQALAAAHRAQIVHRDVKPGNVLVVERPGRRQLVRILDAGEGGVGLELGRETVYDHVKVFDFGIARMMDREARITGSGFVVGTPDYLAPESIEGASPDPRVDVYALGVVFYRLLTGKVPFPGQSSMQTINAVLEGRPVPMEQANPEAEVTDAAEALIMRCMSRQPADRPQSMEELMEGLQQCYGHLIYRRRLHDLPGQSDQGTLADDLDQLLEELELLVAARTAGPDDRLIAPESGPRGGAGGSGADRRTFPELLSRLRRLRGL